MKENCLARLRSRRGESLIESLGALLIIVLAALMLAGAVVAGAKLNRSMQGTVTLALQQDAMPASGTDGSCTCTLSPDFCGDGELKSPITIEIRNYKDDWGFSYYGKK